MIVLSSRGDVAVVDVFAGVTINPKGCTEIGTCIKATLRTSGCTSRSTSVGD
jgi:hypothetical protein